MYEIGAVTLRYSPLSNTRRALKVVWFRYRSFPSLSAVPEGCLQYSGWYSEEVVVHKVLCVQRETKHINMFPALYPVPSFGLLWSIMKAPTWW